MFNWLRVNYLSDEALVNLKRYKYVSGDYSILDKVLNPFWVKCTESFPLWLAPNTITFMGLSCQIMAVLNFLSDDVTLQKRVSPEKYLWASLAIFICQTLDACDGK